MAWSILNLGVFLALVSVISGFTIHKSNVINGQKTMLLHSRIADKSVLALEQLKRALNEKVKKEAIKNMPIKKNNCNQMMNCINEMNDALVDMDPTSSDVCGIVMDAIEDSHDCLDNFKDCSDYNTYKSILDMTVDSISPMCGNANEGVCNMQEAQSAYQTCVETEVSEMDEADDTAEMCRVVDTVKGKLFSCFDQATISNPNCESVHNMYINTVNEMLAPLEEACSDIAGGMDTCDGQFFTPKFEACFEALNAVGDAVDCGAANQIIAEVRKCINNVGKNDTKWTESCEVLRDMMIGALNPVQTELENIC